MKALKDYVVVENLDEDVSKTSGGIYIQNTEKPHVGHFKVLSVGKIDNCELSIGDTVWALLSNVSTSSNFNNDKIGIIKYVNIMAKDDEESK